MTDTDILEKINNHLRTLSPHILSRQSATLLREAAKEITMLRKIFNEAIKK